MIDRLRHFIRRNSLTIGFTIIALALGAILWVQTVALAKIQDQQAAQHQILLSLQNVTGQLTDNANQRTTQIDSINKHLDCIVQFFSQPDRSEKAIADINTCRLNANASSTVNPTTSPQSGVLGGTQTPSSIKNGMSQNVNNGGNGGGNKKTPNFLDKLIAGIKNLINGH